MGLIYLMLITALIAVLIICWSHDVTQGALQELIDRGPYWLSGPSGRQTCPLGWNWVRGWWRGPSCCGDQRARSHRPWCTGWALGCDRQQLKNNYYCCDQQGLRALQDQEEAWSAR